MIGKILKSVKDFEDKILDDTIKVCFLHENSKVSKKGWSGFVTPEELYDTSNANNNLGISLIGAKFPGDKILTCIDVDGDKRDKNIEQFTKDYAYKIITQKLDDENIKYMAIQSSSGGYHIYIYTLAESLRYESTKGLFYPKNLNDSATEEIQMFLSGHIKEFAELTEDEVPKSIVEVWCTKRYMVAPGSDIYDENEQYIGTVTLLQAGVQEFGEIGTIDSNLNDFIRQAFLENGFKEDTRQKYTSNYNISLESNTFSPTLNDFSIKAIGDLIVEVYPKIDGQKHTATLALGGYLRNKGIDEESARRLGEYVVQNSQPGLFKNNEAFIETLVHDIRTNDTTREQTGLPTFEEIFEKFFTKEYIGKKMHLATNPTFHKFWPDGRYSKRFNEIIINHQQNYIIKNIIQTKITNEGDIIDNKVQNYKIEHSVEGIYKVDDISNPETDQDWEKPVQITFKTYKSDLKKSKVYKNPDTLFREYRKLEGVYTDHAKSIIEDIYREYESLGFIQQVHSSTRPGIWFNQKEGKLEKFIQDKNIITQVTPSMPTPDQLQDSLQLLKKINDVYPWSPGKFGFFIKTCLTMPYADVFKYYFDKHHQSIILHGEAGTLKTTAAELIVNFNINSFSDKDLNIISGGELFSEYRFGRAMDSSSFPLVVNETEYLFSTPRIRELIKDSVTGKLIRKPGGNEPQGYYSHRASIYTMNTLPITTEDPAFLRRFIPIEFDGNERGDTPEMKRKLEFLNKQGIKNARFRELAPIGDFVFNTLNQHIDWFNLSIEEIQNLLIQAMEDYTNTKWDFLHQSGEEFIYIDRTDQENYKLTMLLDLLRKPYHFNKGKFLRDSNDVGIVRNLITNTSNYPYVNMINDDEIIIDVGLKHKFNEEHYKDGTTITLKSCYYHLLDLDLGITSLQYTSARVKGRKKQIRGIKISLDDFTRIVTNKEDIS